MAVERWYQVIDLAGREYAFCSGACLTEYAVLGALPADLEAGAANSAGTAESAA
jgi:hypothetical protein